MIKKIFVILLPILIIFAGCFSKGVGEFYDDFSEYPVGSQAPFGDWKVKNGTFIITYPPTVNIPGTQGGSSNNKVVQCLKDGILYIDMNYTNFVYTIDVLVPNDLDSAKIYFRLQDNATRGYYIYIEPFSRGYELCEFDKNHVKKLAESYDAATSYGNMFLRYKIVVTNNSVDLYVQDQKYLEYNGTLSIKWGGVGFGGKGCYFDNVHVLPAGYTY